MENAAAMKAGWLDMSIGDLLAEHEELIRTFSWTLITSLDSAVDMTTVAIAADLTRRHSTSHFLGGALAIQTTDLEGAKGHALFRGFDELWLFETRPTKEKPKEVVIVSPVDFRTSKPTPDLTKWLVDSECRLGLGDGVGLNFITPDDELAARLTELGAK